MLFYVVKFSLLPDVYLQLLGARSRSEAMAIISAHSQDLCNLPLSLVSNDTVSEAQVCVCGPLLIDSVVHFQFSVETGSEGR